MDHCQLLITAGPPVTATHFEIYWTLEISYFHQKEIFTLNVTTAAARFSCELDPCNWSAQIMRILSRMCGSCSWRTKTSQSNYAHAGRWKSTKPLDVNMSEIFPCWRAVFLYKNIHRLCWQRQHLKPYVGKSALRHHVPSWNHVVHTFSPIRQQWRQWRRAENIVI